MMERILTYQIQPSDDGQTILQFLKKNGYTHPALVLLKQTPEGILLNGRWAYVRETLSFGDTLTIRISEPPKETSIVPCALPLTIVYEDEDLLVVDKPAHMPVHPSIRHYENTLANAVAAYCASRIFMYW